MRWEHRLVYSMSIGCVYIYICILCVSVCSVCIVLGVYCMYVYTYICSVCVLKLYTSIYNELHIYIHITYIYTYIGWIGCCDWYCQRTLCTCRQWTGWHVCVYILGVLYNYTHIHIHTYTLTYTLTYTYTHTHTYSQTHYTHYICRLIEIQSRIFDLGACVATPINSEQSSLTKLIYTHVGVYIDVYSM